MLNVDSLLNVESGRKMLGSLRRAGGLRMLQVRLGGVEARSTTSGANVVLLLSLPFLVRVKRRSVCPSVVS